MSNKSEGPGYLEISSSTRNSSISIRIVNEYQAMVIELPPDKAKKAATDILRLIAPYFVQSGDNGGAA